MSDYLFRMIERASGRASIRLPRPPRQFHWPMPLERPVLSERAALSERPAPWETPAFTANSSIESATTTSPTAAIRPTPLADAYSSTPLAPLPQEDFDVQDQDLVAAETNVFEPASRITSSDPTRTLRPNPSRHVVRTSPEAIRESSRADELPAAALAASQERGVAQDRGPAHLPAQSLMSESMREDTNRRTMSHSQLETSEPVVEVNIARVEVRLDVPRQPAPRPAPRPNGFAEFEPLRRYAAGPWPSRRR